MKSIRNTLEGEVMTGKRKSVRKIKKKVGRPKLTLDQKLDRLKFDLNTIEHLALLGLTDKQLAVVLRVDVRTIDRWKKEKEFMSVLNAGKLVADNEMIKSLYKSGLGYEYTEIKKEGADIDSVDLISKVTKTTKYYPPVPASMIFWLKNRQGWADKQEFGGFDDLEITVNLVD